MNRSIFTVSLVATLPLVFACDPPAHPNNYANTVINGICHVAFDCCTPAERQAFIAIASPDKAACLEELGDTFGGFFNNTTVAKEAIDRGAAEFDAEAAERCTKTQLDAINACDMAPLVNGDGGLDFVAFFFLVDNNDAECVALAGRAFTRGKAGAGDACLSSIDCADFGNCLRADGDEDELSIEGKCVPLAGEGTECSPEEAGACSDSGEPCDADEDCDEDNFEGCFFVGCQPGLQCQGDEVLKCEPIERAGNGDECDFDSDCESGLCDIQPGACQGSGDGCEDDFECDGLCVANLCNDGFTECFDDFECGGVCEIEPGECQEPNVTVEICDGL